MENREYIELYCNKGYIGRFQSITQIEEYLLDNHNPKGFLKLFKDFKYRRVVTSVSDFIEYKLIDSTK